MYYEGSESTQKVLVVSSRTGYSNRLSECISAAHLRLLVVIECFSRVHFDLFELFLEFGDFLRRFFYVLLQGRDPVDTFLRISVNVKKVKACFYTGQYPVRWTSHSLITLHPLSDLFILTPTRLLWEEF